jgi:hypothetical protein
VVYPSSDLESRFDANSYGLEATHLTAPPALKNSRFIRGFRLPNYPVGGAIVCTTVALQERQWKVVADHVFLSPDGQTEWHKLFARRASRQGIQQTELMGPRVANHS